MGLASDELVAAFGGLVNGSAPPSLRRDESPRLLNTWHDRQGAVSKRPGRRELARVAAQAEASVAPVLTAAAGASSLAAGTLYVRLTYNTAVGETDDDHSVGASIAVSAGDIVTCWPPFHLPSVLVVLHDLENNVVRADIDVSEQRLSGFAADTFNGYDVFCRDPRLQDETGLGANPNNRKLWDTLRPIAAISDFEVVTATDVRFTLDRDYPHDLTGKRIDIRMPDRNGLSIRAVSVYTSQDDVTYRLHGTYLSDEGWILRPLELTKVDATARKAPSTRYDRSPMTLVASSVDDTHPTTEIITTANSKIPGGEWLFRWTPLTWNPDHLDNGVFPEALDYPPGIRRINRLAPQEGWPSQAAIVAVKDGEGILATLPAKPDGAIARRIYAKRTTPTATLVLDGISHRAYRYAPAGAADPAIFDLSPSGFSSDPDVIEYEAADYTAAGAVNGSFVTAEAKDANRHTWQFLLTAGQKAGASTMCLVISMKGAPAGDISAGETSTLRYWDNDAVAWVPLKAQITSTSTKRTHRLAFTWDPTYATGNTIVLDIIGSGYGGFSIDRPALEVYETDLTTDPAVTDAEVRQIETTGTSVLFDKPLVEGYGTKIRANTTGQWPVWLHAAYVQNTHGGPRDDVAMMVSCADSLFVLQSGVLKRVYSQDAPNGSTDSTTFAVLRQPWVMTHKSNRVWACNEGLTSHCLRFDGVQTHIMGLAEPQVQPALPEDAPPSPPGIDCSGLTIEQLWTYDPITERAQSTNHAILDGLAGGPIGGWDNINMLFTPRWRVTDPADPPGTYHWIYDWRQLTLDNRDWLLVYGTVSMQDREGSVFEGSLRGPILGGDPSSLYIYTISTSNDYITCAMAGAVPDVETTPPTTGDGLTGEFEWYYCDVRSVTEAGRSYVVRSKPVRVQAASPDNEVVRLFAPPPLDPQVTHGEFFRNLAGTAQYFLVRQFPIGEPGPNGYYSVVDDRADDKLAYKAVFDTGRPPGASTIIYANGRNWFVPVTDKDIVSMTNLVTVQGAIDREGFYPLHTIQPSLPRGSAITALADYGPMVVAMSDNGMAGIIGLSLDLNSPDHVKTTKMFSDVGALSQFCWTRSDSVLFVMTRQGPIILNATEPDTTISTNVEGTTKKLNLTDDVVRRMSVVKHRSRGTGNVIFTGSTRSDGMIDKALAFDLNVGPGRKEPRRLWSEWDFDAYSMVEGEADDGEEYVFLGDHQGGVHQHGFGLTDNGIFIDWDYWTKPFSGKGRTFRPHLVYTDGLPRPGECILLEVYNDYRGAPVNDRPMRIYFGAENESEVLFDCDTGIFVTCPDSASYALDRKNLGRPFRRLALRYRQTWADLPPGHPRESTFELSQFTLANEDLGFRGPG